MIRPFVILALAFFCGGILPLPGAALPPPPGFGSTSQNANPGPTRGANFRDPTANNTGVDDKVLANYLPQPQRAQFEDDVKKAADALDEINTGLLDANATETKGSIIKTGADQTRKNAQEKITEGRKVLFSLASELQSLRKTAMDNMAKAKDEAKVTASVVYSVATGQLPDVLQPMADKTLAALAEQDVKHVYLAGVYVFQDNKYQLNADLTDQLRNALTQADKSSKIFTAKTSWRFKIAVEGGHQIVSYPERSADKAALVLGEVLYDPDSGYAAFSVRGVDLSNMKIVSNQFAMLSVEPSLGKMLDLSALRVPSKRLPATAGGGDKTVPPALTVTVQDPLNRIGQVKDAKALTRVVNAVDNTSLNNRFTALVLKSFLNGQLDVPVTDYDVLTMALGPDQPLATDITAVWVLPDVPSLNMTNMDLLLRLGRDNVGKLSIQRNLPKLTGPTANDLRAGGYVLGGASGGSSAK